ncbi:hypothetical protein [Rachiplusia nu nucleopolyhedrovirus]|uniref:Ac55 n=1 Tax=Rachiplusia nu nucleopolyhedrovirus TaxID=2605775 RepID=A0AAF1DB29_9ABAC|nr:hypothetical protein QKQ55_gp047 [Rachiplusia nu nucleopolyhedrovirus]QEI03597.1 hypothetical protein [Rachiplusia nu nucleopolyhedrovirus]
MSRLNFQLKNVINKTVDIKLKDNNCSPTTNKEYTSHFYNKHKEDVSYVGRETTYNVVGQRNFKNFFDEKKYRF